MTAETKILLAAAGIVILVYLAKAKKAEANAVPFVPGGATGPWGGATGSWLSTKPAIL